jgi:hypothetical protein
MTYRELAERIDQLNDYQKDYQVTYSHDGVYHGKLFMDFADVRTEDRLDGWHPYLTQFETDAVNRTSLN